MPLRAGCSSPWQSRPASNRYSHCVSDASSSPCSCVRASSPRRSAPTAATSGRARVPPPSQLIAVCGATGALGGRVAAHLSERGAAIRLIVRDPARAPALDGAEVAVAAGYHDTEEMTAALRGAATVFLVSGRESPNRLDEHRSAVDAAVAAGVGRIVYTSFANASPDTAFKLGRQ